jgi:hypothetical protein
MLQHLEQYRPILNISLQRAAVYVSSTNNPKAGNIKRNATWLSLAASVVVLLGIGTYHNYDDATNSQNLGTYDDPEEAFRATQKALSIV